MSEKLLDPRPARELTSREAAKLLGGTVGALATLCPPETIMAALNFYTSGEYQVQHKLAWEAMWKDAVRSGHVVPEKR